MNLPAAFRGVVAVAILYPLYPTPLPVERPDAPQAGLLIAKLQAGGRLITAQLALTPEQQQKGLMFRRSMRQDEGMLFVYKEPAVKCFWMKNTFLPLTVAFVASDGSIASLADMEPESTRSSCSNQPVRFVLEMNRGWFDRHACKVGCRLNGRLFGGA